LKRDPRNRDNATLVFNVLYFRIVKQYKHVIDGGSMEEIIQIVTTADDRSVIEKIGRDLVERRLVACAQILGPIQSIYRWKGAVEDTNEWLLLMKSKASLYPGIEEEIRRQHPYEVPEIIAISIDKGLTGYLDWVAYETK
jgi:periplasmic divalent cation tolerance protein